MDGFVYVRDGHLFESDPENPALEMDHEMGDHHSGPHCVICDRYWCKHCDPEIYAEKCSRRDEPTLEGLEYRQPMIKGVVGRRIYIADVPTVRRLRR